MSRKENNKESFDKKLSRGSNDKKSSVVEKISWTSLPADLEEKIVDLTGPIRMRANAIHQKDPVNWLPYVEEDIISHDDYSFINAFQFAQSKEERDALLNYFKDQAYISLREIVQKVTDVEDMQKLLVLIEDMIWEDESRADGFKPETTEPWKDFMPLLQWEDDFVRNLASRIISTFAVSSEGRPSLEDLKVYLNWLKDELRLDNPYLQSVARCLQKMLRLDDYRIAFMTLSGIFKIVKLLSTRLKPQAQYQFSFCLWVTSFNPLLAEKMNRSGTIPILADVLQNCPSEIIKLPRVILATFRNLLEKPREPGVRRHNTLVMIQCKLLNFLGTIEQKVEDCNDPEYAEDYTFIMETLNSYAAELSTFDEYYIEIKSRRLEWSMVHKSRKFWVENAERLNENKYELLKILIELLETSKDNVVLCIATHDVGEYMRQYSRGKKIIEDLGGKKALIRLLGYRHPTVKYYALKTLQVLMLNNYELFTEYQSIAKNLSEKWSELNLSSI